MEDEINWSDIFKRIYKGEKMLHRDVDPKRECDNVLEIKRTHTGGIETLGIWCPTHGFLKAGFAGP